MIKVIIEYKERGRIDIFECIDITIDTTNKTAFFTLECNENKGRIMHKKYTYDSFNTITNYIMFEGSKCVR